MKFTRVIHPEIVMNQRGPWDLREYYQASIQDFDRLSNGVYTGSLRCDRPELLQLRMAKHFLEKRPPIYHVGADFLTALSQVKRDIPFHILPESFFAYLSFPPDTLKDQDSYALGAYVWIGEGSELFPSRNKEKKTKLAVSVVYGTKDDPRTGMGYFVSELASKDFEEALSPNKKLEDRYGVEIYPTEEALRSEKNFYRAIINTICYVHSQNPELERVKSVASMSLRQKSLRAKQTGILNECTLPVIFVNWRWKRSIEYTKENTKVSGHFRWQACGPAHTQRRLVFIDEHLRHYEGVVKTVAEIPIQEKNPPRAEAPASNSLIPLLIQLSASADGWRGSHK
jgi:hypothetical protein